MLQYSANFFANVVSRWVTKPGKISSGWVDYAHQHAEGSRLAAAIRTQHAEDFASLHLQVKVINSAKSSEILGELLSGEYRFQKK